MKFNTPLIILDLEATSSQILKEVRPTIQENRYIIDVGAVVVRQNQYGILEIGESFSQLVKPEEQITPYITEITGITNEMVKHEPLFSQVGPQFQSWVQRQVGNIKNARLCPWGSYFDTPLLRKMYEKYGLKYPFSGTSFDSKTIAALYYALSGRNMKELSVQSCAKDLGIKPKGAYHRAWVDAEVTAQIVVKAVNDISTGHYVKIKNGQPYSRFKIEIEEN